MGYHGVRFSGTVALLAAALVLLAALSAAAQNGAPVEPLVDTASHRLAEGDYLLAQFFDGQRQQDYYLQVDSAGEVRMPLVEAVAVAGLTPREAAELLTDEYRVYYHKPYVALQVLRRGQFEVFLFGPDFPGQMYKLDNGTRLSDLWQRLKLAEPGRYRRVHVIRGDLDFYSLTAALPPALPALADGASVIAAPSPGAVARDSASLAGHTNWRGWVEERIEDPDSQVWVIDPLAITLEGELSRYNVELRKQDVIYVPTAERFVEVQGTEVPGRYELLTEETLGDVLRLAGTVDYAGDLVNTVVTRRDDCGNLERLIFNLFPALDNLAAIECFELMNRDVISIVPREQRIFVLGEVNLAGAFAFVEDSTPLDYIALAGGETPSANMPWIAIIRQGRNRLDQLPQAEVIQVNFKEIAKGLPLCTDISLLPGDIVYVPPKGFQFEFGQIIQTVSAAVTSFAVVDNANNN